MNATEQTHLLRVLADRRGAIAHRWYAAIAHTSFVPLSSVDVCNRLVGLTDALIAALFTEPFNPFQVQAVGAGLVGLHYMQPESLGRTLNVLAQQLMAGLSAAQIGELQPQLIALLSELATGFFRAVRETILAQQERLHGALFTEQVRVETALRESETRFRTIFNGAAIGIGLTDSTGRIVESNAALHAMLGYSEEELRHMMFTKLIHPDDVARSMESFQRLMAGNCDSYHHEKRYIRKDGRVLWGSLNVSLVRDARGEPQFALGMVEDITERRRVAAELAAAQRRLAERLEAERRHFARELHDSAVQQRLGISYQLIERQRRSAADQPDGLAGADRGPDLEDIRREVLGVVSQLRSLIGELRPAGLDELGLTTALEGYVARLRREGDSTMPRIDLYMDQSGTRLPRPVALCLFRSAQEALRNALRHAEADRITLRLNLLPDEVVLSVRDDGCGFQVPARLSELTHADHFGLVGIAEQVALTGGRCTISSQPGAGTEVLVRIQLHNPKRDDD